MPRNSETVWVEGTVEATTAGAVLLDDGDRKVWLPRSYIKDHELPKGGELNGDAVGERASIEIPEWLAIEKELV